jgi:hypothetical protein
MKKPIDLDTNTNKLILKATGDLLSTPILTPRQQKISVQTLAPKANNEAKNFNLKFEIY